MEISIAHSPSVSSSSATLLVALELSRLILGFGVLDLVSGDQCAD
jgi:hypothetical protein